MQDPNRKPIEKKVVGDAAKNPQTITTKVKPEAAITVKTKEGTELTVVSQDTKALSNMTTAQQAQGSDVKAHAGEPSDVQTDSKGNIQSAEITIYAGTWEISADGKAAGKSQEAFVTDTFIHESDHVGGQKYKPDPDVKNELGY